MAAPLEVPDRAGRQVHGATVAVVLSLALALGSLVLRGSPDQRTAVDDAQEQLWAGIETPLRDAGLVVEVTETCHLPFPRIEDDGSVHLHVEMDVEAPRTAVAAVLRDAGAVVVGDRDPMVVQQHPGSPRTGWNGILDGGTGGTGASSVLALTFSGVRPELADLHGWLEVCHAR